LLFLITEPVGRTLARYKTWALAGAALCVTAAAILAAVILGNQERPVSFQSTPAASPAMRAQPALTPSPALPSASPADTVQAKYADFYAENQDMAGWITVGNTVIDYPVVQGVDNTYYMDHDFYGEESRHGAIFASAGSGLEDIENTKNVVLYGHHMKDGSMFAGLDAYKDESFFCENSIIRFCTLYRDYEWKVFAVYVSPVTFAYNDTTFLSGASWEKFLNACREKSMFDSGVTPTAQDVVLTLSTCSYEFSNARFVVQAVLIRNPES
jgi:sortase B